jgi:hypothetical protein
MNRSRLLWVSAILFLATACFSQQNVPADSSKATLDKLASLTHLSEAEWQFHADVPHPEDARLDDKDWGVWTVKNVSGPGGRNTKEEHWS